MGAAGEGRAVTAAGGRASAGDSTGERTLGARGMARECATAGGGGAAGFAGTEKGLPVGL